MSLEPKTVAPADEEASALAPEVECAHAEFEAAVEVGRFRDVEGGPITHYSAAVTVECASCHRPFAFIGPMQVGMLPMVPTVNAERTVLHAPIEPRGARKRGRLGFVANLVPAIPRVLVGPDGKKLS